jgi:tetratricopeptide (TPR) repeat protein
MTFPEIFAELSSWHDQIRQAQSGSDLIRAIEARIQQESHPSRLRILNIFLAREHIAQGNEAAADIIRYNDPLEQVHRWHVEWREANSEADIIPILQTKLRDETEPNRRVALHHLLAEAYSDKGDYASAAEVRIRESNERPNEPMPLISLASQKFFEEERPEEAMRIIDQAIEVALREGTYRRLAFGMKARIALHLKNYPAVEDAIRQIMDLKFGRGNVDIGRERDFFDGLPPGSIDLEVARRYDEYSRARGKPLERKD